MPAAGIEPTAFIETRGPIRWIPVYGPDVGESNPVIDSGGSHHAQNEREVDVVVAPLAQSNEAQRDAALASSEAMLPTCPKSLRSSMVLRRI